MICFVYLLMKPQPYQYYVMYKDYNLLQIPSYCVTKKFCPNLYSNSIRFKIN